MYFESLDAVKLHEIARFVAAIKNALSFCDNTPDSEDEGIRIFASVKTELCETSQLALRNGQDDDGDTPNDVVAFMDRLIAEPDFRQYMSGRVTKIEDSLGVGRNVEVVPLRHQYGNYRAMRMRV